MNLIQASELLAKLQIGVREGIALGVIASLGGTAQAHHVVARLKPYSVDPRAILAVLRKKGMVQNTGQLKGSSPFWSLTPKAAKMLATAKKTIP
jgi:hypothetical protein